MSAILLSIPPLLALAWLLFRAGRRRFDWTAPVEAPSETRGGAGRTTVTVATPSGERIEAWLYLPAGPPAPLVVLAPGLAGTKEGPLERFAWAFAEAGFAALCFDFRSFGGSEGWPRHHVDMRAQVADFSAVVEHARSGRIAGIDATRIALWGTSFSGAAAVCAAASMTPPPAAVVLHLPYLGAPARPPGIVQVLGYIGLVVAEQVGDAAAALVGVKLPPVYIAAYGRPGEGAFAASRDCPSRRGGVAGHGFWTTLPRTWRGGWTNLMLVRGLPHLDAIDPAAALATLRCAALVVAAVGDDMIAIERTRALCRGIGSIRLVEIAGGHFDPYVDPCFRPNAAAQVEFLRAVLSRATVGAQIPPR